MMDFSAALKAVKSGNKISRKGWNADNLFVVYQRGYPKGIAINSNTSEATGIPVGTVCVFRPYFMLNTTNDEFVPWVPTQSDLVEDDWYIIGIEVVDA